MTAERLAARCLDLLGPLDGPIAVVAPPRVRAALARRVGLAQEGSTAHGAVCVFLGEPADPDARQARLDALGARLASGAPLVVADHNQPRAWWRRLLGTIWLAARGLPPRRARHPVAREVHGRGFEVVRLGLAAGERVQLVLARRR